MTSSPEVSTRHRRLLEQVFELTARLADGMGEELERQGLTRARAELLWRLDAAGPLTQRALSELLACTPRNVTGLVDALEGAGLARRDPHPTDRRATLVSLTDEGRTTLARWRGGYEALAERLFGHVAEEDLRGFEGTLGHMLDGLREAPLDADRHDPAAG